MLDVVLLRRQIAGAEGNILDLRAIPVHEAGHLPGSSLLSIEPELAAQPAAQRHAWLTAHLPSIFLPPRGEPLLVLGERLDLAQQVAGHLTRRGRTPVAARALAREDLARLPADLRCRGRSPHVLWRPPEILRRWAHLLPPAGARRGGGFGGGGGGAGGGRGRPGGRGTGGAEKTAARVPADPPSRGPPPPVPGRPPPILRRGAHGRPPAGAGRVLDLACGSGRAAVWLARRGWRVTGVDHQTEALSLAARLAASCGVALDLRAADLRRRDSLPPGRWSVVLLLRFLDRDLLRRVPDCLGREGVVMLSTFRDAPGFLGNPRRQHRLRRGEAAALWPRDDFEVLVHEEGFDGDGLPTASAIWRRIGAT